MKSHFRICLGATFLTFMLVACNPRKTGDNGSKKVATPLQATEPAAPIEDEITRLLRLAEQGDAAAQFDLGFCYHSGNLVLKNSVEATKWYRKAAEQGNPKAQYYLGSFYDRGEGVSKDQAEAAKWYGKAAELGDASAQFCLGLCYGKQIFSR